MNAILDRLHLALARLKRQALRHLTAIWILLPVTLLALALAGYGWWWQVVADSVRTNVATFQAGQRALGREIRWDSFDLAGFPYRVQGTLNMLHLTAPDRGAAYDGERVVVHVQPFALNRIALSLEGQQHFFYAKERWIEANVRADKSLVTLSSAKGVGRIDLDVERLTGKAKIDDKDLNLIVERARGGLQVSEASAREPLPRVEFLARLKNVALQGNVDLPLGSSISWLDIDAAAMLPANLPDASATSLFDAWRSTGTPLEIRSFELEWGGISIAASGEIKIDSQSLPEGRLRLTLGNHPRILELLHENGWIRSETQVVARKVLDVLAFMSGDEQRRVSVPLKIEKGTVYLGPAPVGTLTPPVASAQLMPLDIGP
mgnify:CR=1 FL=1